MTKEKKNGQPKKVAILSKKRLHAMDRFWMLEGEKGKTRKLEVGSCAEKGKRTLIKMPPAQKGNSKFGVPTWNLEVPKKDL